MVSFLKKLGVKERALEPFLSVFREPGGETLYAECVTVATSGGITLSPWADAIDFVVSLFNTVFTQPMQELLQSFPDGVKCITGHVGPAKLWTQHLSSANVRTPSYD